MADSIAVILKLCNDIPVFPAYIGVDKGALTLTQANVRMLLAIGDFDSVAEDDMHRINTCADEVIRLNPIKDDTDSQAAVEYALQHGFQKIYMYGGIGGRLDHTLINLRLIGRYPLQVYLVDETNLVYSLSSGTHFIHKAGYAYLSVFTDETAVVSLKGMKYPLQQRLLTKDDTYTSSNEIVEEIGEIIVHRGSVIVIQSKD